jgi:hypothetical protein
VCVVLGLPALSWSLFCASQFAVLCSVCVISSFALRFIYQRFRLRCSLLSVISIFLGADELSLRLQHGSRFRFIGSGGLSVRVVAAVSCGGLLL